MPGVWPQGTPAFHHQWMGFFNCKHCLVLPLFVTIIIIIIVPLSFCFVLFDALFPKLIIITIIIMVLVLFCPFSLASFLSCFVHNSNNNSKCFTLPSTYVCIVSVLLSLVLPFSCYYCPVILSCSYLVLHACCFVSFF